MLFIPCNDNVIYQTVFEELVGGTELENYLHQNVHIFETFRLTLVKKNRQNGERKKMSGYL